MGIHWIALNELNVTLKAKIFLTYAVELSKLQNI